MHYAVLPILVSYTLLLLVLAQHSVLFAMVFSKSVFPSLCQLHGGILLNQLNLR